MFSMKVAGPVRDVVIAELKQHTTDDLRHADMVSSLIIQIAVHP
jgi:hypothetical protein